jgi:tetratricopeptide (TPR) repeat protein
MQTHLGRLVYTFGLYYLNKTMILLAELQALYDRNRFLEAYRLSADYWNPSTRTEDLSADELIFGGRLAWRLGGSRLSRWLFRKALERDPAYPRARYFALGVRTRAGRLFDQLRAWEEQPDLPGADPETQANWIATQAVTWASLRDFSRAHFCIERAQSIQEGNPWVLSCESDVLGLQDRWDEALKSAELAWEINPGAPYAAHSLSESLLNLRRIRDATDRLVAAAGDCESFEIAYFACWHLCALAETVEGDERVGLLRRAKEFALQLPILAPLSDRDSRTLFARINLDVAEMEDDHPAMERWAKEVRSPFHRIVLENLRSNPSGLRIRLPFRRAIQKHEACLPTSIASSLAAMGIPIDPDAMASEITFGGTPEWAAAQWLEKRGLEVRFFVVVPEVAASLIKNGIAFVMTLESDASAHAVAVVGLDEGAGTLIIHDPQTLRTTEYLLGGIGKDETPLGPKGMVVIPPEKAVLVDRLLPRADVEAMTATESFQQAILLRGTAAAREVVAALAERQPSHPITFLLQAFQALEDGRVGIVLVELQKLMKIYPESAVVRARLLSCCRSFGDTALMRSTLASVVERGTLPGIQSQQSWFHPPSAYVSEYADLLRASATLHEKASRLLHGVIRRESSCAQAWHNLADLLYDDRDIPGALLAYRIASCLASSTEHYARAYCDALANASRKEEGLQWLEARVRTFGASSQAIATWITWINALEDLGHPERALAASDESLAKHHDSPDLLAFVVPFLARMGRWQDAETLLDRLKTAGNPALYYEAAADFYRRRGELSVALEHAESWVNESPLSMPARRELLHLVSKRDGALVALQLASAWVMERPGHDELEQIYCQYLDEVSSNTRKKYSLLRRRVKRNPDDGWAWRELTFMSLSQFDFRRDGYQKKLARRIPQFIACCERIAPQHPATLRVRAQWSEAHGDWTSAIDFWLESIDRDPDHSYGYRQVFESLARSSPDSRKHIWEKISAKLISYPGRLSTAREVIMLAAQWFGVVEAEQSAFRWTKTRPDDPEVIEAAVDLFLDNGQGRTDYRRALDLAQPSVERFPFHLGLRFSLADALRKLGKSQEAEKVLDEIIRRHPDNSPARIQLARVHERHGDVDAALRVLKFAATLDPQNTGILDVQAQVLIAAGRRQEARGAIVSSMSQFQTSVNWREKAIRLLVDCGDHEAAVQTAREGIRIFPRGAYLWFLLGRTLHDNKGFAVQGEVEAVLRRSLELNHSLFSPADCLAVFLVEQHRFDEAEEVMVQIRDWLQDPSPAMGRLAWIHRQKGEKPAAREEMAALLRAAPWYFWGWNLFLDWIVEDKTWTLAINMLGSVPPELKTNTQFRRKRLLVLEKSGLPAVELDSEWDSLLRDFPEDVSLHLVRYDSLRNANRLEDAAAVLEVIRPFDPESPYVLARFVEVIAGDQKEQERTIDSTLRIFFAEADENPWPADYAWKAIKAAHLEELVYLRARDLFRQGSHPTAPAISILASFAVERGKTVKLNLQPLWRRWFPDPGGRELLFFLKILDSMSWPTEPHRAILIRQLCDFGYAPRVVAYWKKNKMKVEAGVESWAQVGRALVILKRKPKARKLLAHWRERTGVGMWVLANYVICLSALRSKQLRETVSTCRDALSGLPHNQCAKFLVHRQAEAAILLGDTKTFTESYDEHKSYFNGKLEKGEWFETKRKYLMTDLPYMARWLQENNIAKYKRGVWSLRWKRISDASALTRTIGKRFKLRWVWIIIWLIWMLSLIIQNR